MVKVANSLQDEIRDILQMQRDDPSNSFYEEATETMSPDIPTGALDGSLGNFSQGSVEQSSQDTQTSDAKDRLRKPRPRRREWFKRSKACTTSSVELDEIQGVSTRASPGGIR